MDLIKILYIGDLLSTIIFAITGLISSYLFSKDYFLSTALGMLSAIGGGTVRDAILYRDFFWMEDGNYILCAAAGIILGTILIAFVKQQQ